MIHSDECCCELLLAVDGESEFEPRAQLKLLYSMLVVSLMDVRFPLD